MSFRFCRRLFPALMLTALFSIGSFGDEVYGRIRGLVTDPSGAALAGVQVTATNVSTGLSRTVASQSNGTYEFPQLPIGTYTVKASNTNFKTFMSTQFPLAVNQIYYLPIGMQVGEVSQTVEVTANGVQVETTNTQLQTLVDHQKIVDLPLINRNWTSLEQLVPGVVAASDRFGTFSSSGSQSNQSSYLINGMDSNDLPLNQPAVVPSPDAISEFNVITNTINPEYGRNSGAIVNAVIANGTNNFHGDVFEFYRDSFLNTHNFLQKTAPVFHQNLFGGTLGGPILKNKTFFFLSYQGNRNRRPQPGAANLVNVPTDAQRNGDFSANSAFSNNLSPFPLKGTNGTVFPAGTPYSTIFPGNVIPTSDFNSISANFLNKFVPHANFNTNKFSFNPIRTSTQDQGIARIDHNFSSKDSVWGVLLFDHAPEVDELPFLGATLPGFGETNLSDTHQFIADWNHTFNATTLNEFRIGYTRSNLSATSPTSLIQPSSAGFAINPSNPLGANIPFIGITGFFSLGFSIDGPQPRKDQTYELTDNFNKIVGQHSLKFGFDGRRFDVWNPFSSRVDGSFSFSASNNSVSTGNALADFLLGMPKSYNQQSGGIIIARAYEGYSYFQDSWKVLRNLTVNYGVGWQVDTGLHNNQFGGVDVGCFIPGQQSKIFSTAPTGLDYPGDPGCTNAGGVKTKWGHFGPRAGFAYSPGETGKLSVRGGVGLFYNRTEEEGALQNLGTPPFSLASSGAADVGGHPSFANPFADIRGNAANSEANRFPFVPPGAGSAPNFKPFENPGLSINVFDPHFTAPYAINFNLTVQRELAGNMVGSIGYVGSLGRHLYRSFEGNYVTPANAAVCAANPQCAGDPFFMADFPNLSIFPGNVFEGLGVQGTNGSSSYHAIQASLNKGLTHGLSFLLSYTYSHAIDDGSGLEDTGFNLRSINPIPGFQGLNIGDSSYDARHRFVASYSYLVPDLHNHFGILPTALFGGWQLTGITTLQTGFPINIGDSGFTSLTCDANDFFVCFDNPNQVSAVQLQDPKKVANGAPTLAYFNGSAFAVAAPGTFGNVHRNSIHGPSFVNTDFAIIKNTHLWSESRYLQLRLEGYNVFNHTQFCQQGNSNGTPCVDGDIQSSTFGQVLTAQPGRLVQLGAKFYF